MRMKDFSPYTLTHISFASTLEGGAIQAKLKSNGTTIATLHGIGSHQSIQAVFSTSPAEHLFNAFIDSLDDSFLYANVPSIHRGRSFPTTPAQKRQYVLEAMVEHTTDDKQLYGRCRHNTLYRLKEDLPHRYRVLKVLFTEKVRAAIIRDYGEKLETILNDQIRT